MKNNYNGISRDLVCMLAASSFLFLQGCLESKKHVERVQSSSMKPTIMPSDSVTWFEIEPEYTCRKGEIVIINSPVGKGKWIRRVVGLEGDVVEVRAEGAVINGKLESWEELTGGASKRSEKTTPATKVPKGHLYLIGDNLANSRDSREFGPLSEKSIVGIVVLTK